ncbi:MAG: class I SAM-dependent methyltransferase [Defluviitaleaceae bacterium]|nr:class I SAM-dependent methyltransferase [Defluviitaleaceae bacterium]
MKINYADKLIDLIYDYKYGIETCREQEFDRRMINFGYKPTPYRNLRKIFRKYKFTENNHLIDYGCGKGRVLFMAALNGCKKATGIEINSDMYDIAIDNVKSFNDKHKIMDNRIQIINADAMKYQLENSADTFFFFNPFHMKVFIYVLNIIKNSVISYPRSVKIFLINPKESVIWTIERMQFFTSKEESKTDNYSIYFYDARTDFHA